MKMIAFSCGLFLMSTAVSEATCIKPSWERGYLRFFNSCSVGVAVTFRTTGQLSCRSTRISKYPCSAYVGPGKKRMQLPLIGRGPRSVIWVECKSPGGKADVIAVEKSYGKVVCLD